MLTYDVPSPFDSSLSSQTLTAFVHLPSVTHHVIAGDTPTPGDFGAFRSFGDFMNWAFFMTGVSGDLNISDDLCA